MKQKKILESVFTKLDIWLYVFHQNRGHTNYNHEDVMILYLHAIT